jgi:hypothetical protein
MRERRDQDIAATTVTLNLLYCEPGIGKHQSSMPALRVERGGSITVSRATASGAIEPSERGGPSAY